MREWKHVPLQSFTTKTRKFLICTSCNLEINHRDFKTEKNDAFIKRSQFPIMSRITRVRFSEEEFSTVCLVGGDLEDVNVARLGGDIKHLDLSYNNVFRIRGLATIADCLEVLILNNNRLGSLALTCIFPKLHTISMNKNKVEDLKLLLEILKVQAPNLKYLSLLGNPCCPDSLSDRFVDETDYQIYRYHVVHHLRGLSFLDHRAVSHTERLEASKAILYSAIKPGKKRATQGKRRFKYVGKNSEGNRFIKDGDL